MKDSTITPIFCTPIFKSEMDRKFNKKELDFFKKHKGKIYFNAGNSKSKNNYLLNEPDLKDVKKFILKKIYDYIENVVCPAEKIEPYITQSWLAVTENNQHHHTHSHPNSYISGVLYVNAREKEDCIVFVNKKYEQLKVYPKDWNIFNAENWWVPVKTGDLILFPSDVEHKVNIKETKSTRISLSFNVFIKGFLGNNQNLTGLELK